MDEELTIVKVTDLKTMIKEVKILTHQVMLLREQSELRAYSLYEVAELISLSYTTVRKLVQQGKLAARYVGDDKGKCVVPALEIKKYLANKV